MAIRAAAHTVFLAAPARAPHCVSGAALCFRLDLFSAYHYVGLESPCYRRPDGVPDAGETGQGHRGDGMNPRCMCGSPRPSNEAELNEVLYKSKRQNLSAPLSTFTTGTSCCQGERRSRARR